MERYWYMEESALRLRVAAEQNPDAEFQQRQAAPVTMGNQPGGMIAVMQLFGNIAQRSGWMTGVSTIEFGRAFAQLIEDPAIGAIVLEVDSPGGSVAGVDELAAQIFAARGSKPIVAVANSLMASAAYYIASAADRVLAAPAAMVGSIGIWTVHLDLSRALEAGGVKVTFIKAGKYKMDGSPLEPLGEVAAAAIQGDVDHYYGMFVDAVARHRGVKSAAVRGGYGEGRMLTGRAAVDAGLVDGIATMGQVLADMKVKLAGPGSRAARQATVDRNRARMNLLLA
jgi:signal peptide peptidase SppA